MANPIDLIITKQALEVVDSAIAKVNLLDKTMQEATQHFIDNSKKMASATPSGVNGSAENNAAVTAQLKAQSDTIAKLSKELENLNNKLVKLNETKAANKKLTIEETVANQALRKTAVEEAKANSELIGSYEKLNIKHQQAVRNAQNLGATYGSTSKQFLDASKTANILDEELKTLDSTLGKNQRNVGNYKSGYNALGNSINQLTREAPAFANSINTGFMAISNNIPALNDAISNLRRENAQLAKDGLPTKSIFKELAGSIFSWQTLISVGVTLLTIYGGKLVNLALGLGDVEAELKKVKKEQDKYNTSLEQANSNIEHNLRLEKNRRKVLGESEESISKLDKEAGKAKLENFKKAEALAKKELDLEANKVLTRKHYNEVGFKDDINISEKLNAEKIRLEQSLGSEIVKFTYLARTEKEKAEVNSLSKVNAKLKALEILNGDEIYKIKKENYIKSYNATLKAGQQLSELVSDIDANNADKNKTSTEKFKSEVLQLSEKFAKKELEALAESEHDKYRLLVQQSFNELDLAIKTDDEKIKQMKISEDEKKILLLENAKNAIIARRNISNAMIAEEKKLLTKESNAIANLTKGGKTPDIKDVDKSSDSAIKAMIKHKEVINSTKKSMEELNKSTMDWLDSFSSEFLSNSGLGSLGTFFDGTFNKLLAGAETTQEKFAVTFNAIAESAQEAFNLISGYSQQNFDSEKERLQSQYDVSLKYAGDNKEAQAKLADDLETRKKEIANREAKAKQKQAIFNIAIDTAQAIVASLPNIPLSIAIGVIGAVQLAMVASQEVPQYWMGGTHDGGLMMVNDGAGSNYQETIVTPDGKIMKPTGRNVIMDAPAGTEIYTKSQWDQTLFDMLQGKGISMSANNQYSGITKADLEEVMLSTLGSQTNHYSNFDADGATEFITKNGNKTILKRNRGNGIGKKV